MRAQLIVVMVVASASAQAPGYTGTWVATKEPPEALAAAPVPAFGERFALRESGDGLTVVRPVRDTATAVTFTLDGRETRARVPGGLCQGDAETVETAARDGDALVLSIVGAIPPGGGTMMKRDIRRTLRLQSPDVLVVETRMTVQGQLRPVATVYRRSSDVIAAPPPAAPKAPATIANVAWIGGTWVGTTRNQTVEERWTPASGGAMLAVARTLRDGVMTAFEFVCINERGGTLVYSAMPNGRSPATHFTLTAVTADSATFENPTHDFPKVVRYSRRPDGSLETMVAGEGGQRPETFVLHRQQ